MEIKLRLEEKKDHKIVEEVVREAFWNIHSKGCDEHLLIHKLRDKPEFIDSLDFVAICDNKIVANIVYVESKIIDNSNKPHKVLTFGPISVLPEYQHNGIGSKLITHTANLAKKLGYKAILIYGDPDFYKKLGFKESKEFKITNQDKKYPAPLLVLELYPNSLKGINGIFDEGNIYDIDDKELDEFEKDFPSKEKKFTKTQERFLELSNKFL